MCGIVGIWNSSTERPLDVATARGVLRQAPGVLLMDESQSGSSPTLADAMDQDATLVGRVREDLSVPYGVNLWAVIDGLRKGAAVNAVQIACEIVAYIAQRARAFRDHGTRDDAYDVPYTTTHVGTIRGGTALNIVPRDCTFDFEIIEGSTQIQQITIPLFELQEL